MLLEPTSHLLSVVSPVVSQESSQVISTHRYCWRVCLTYLFFLSLREGVTRLQIIYCHRQHLHSQRVSVSTLLLVIPVARVSYPWLLRRHRGSHSSCLQSKAKQIHH